MKTYRVILRSNRQHDNLDDDVVVLPAGVGEAVRTRAKAGASTVALISYPYGASKPVIKAIEATSCLKDGAAGVWIVPRSTDRMFDSPDAIRIELLEIARAVRATRSDAQLGLVIDATSIASGEHFINACRATREGAADVLIVTNVTMKFLAPFHPIFSQHGHGLSLIVQMVESSDALGDSPLNDSPAGVDLIVGESLSLR